MHNRVPKTWYVGWSSTLKTATLDVGGYVAVSSKADERDAGHQHMLLLREVKTLQEKARRAGVDQLLLTGQEPTLRRDLGAIIRGGTKRGLVVGVRTDGRRFMLEGYATKMAESGLRYAEVELMGPERIHDALTSDGSHAQTCAGIDALLDAGVEVVLTCPVLPRNAEHLDFLSGFAAQRPSCTLAFVRVDSTVDPRCFDDAMSLAAKRGVPAQVWNTAFLPEPQESIAPPLQTTPIENEADRSAPSLLGVPIVSDLTQFRVPEMGRLDTSPRYPDTALITLIVAGCDLNCIFCETPQGDSPPRVSSLQSVKQALSVMRESTSGVYLTGGEPSGVPWIFDALRHAKSLGYRRIQMQSHAGRASDPAYAERLVQAGLTAIDIPFYGPTAEVHEAITKTPGSFERTLQGMRNLKQCGVEVCVHVTLFQSNLESLSELVAFWNGLNPTAGYVQTSGEVGQPGTYQRVAPSPSVVGSAFSDAIERAKPQFPLFIVDVAPCHIPDHADRIVRWRGSIEESSSCLVMPYSDWLMTFTGGDSRAQGHVCRDCQVQEACDGLSNESLHLFGESELKPL